MGRGYKSSCNANDNEYIDTINGPNGWKYSTLALAGITELNKAYMVDVSAEYNGNGQITVTDVFFTRQVLLI